MFPFTVLILIVFTVGAFGFIDEGTELNFDDELSSSEDFFKEIGEWEGRIVGGSDARRGQFPHQVSLQLGTRHHCGGSILNRFFVLTAAHCIRAETSIPGNILVVVGALRRVEDGSAYAVRSIHNHPEFSIPNRANDISIIRTVNKILFNTHYVRPVRLPINNVPVAGNYTVYVSGWGRTSNPGQAAEILQYKTAVTLNRERCMNRLESNGNHVYENTVCVDNPAGRGVCFGDSGGPLISQHGVLVGVVSWGIPCARGVPDVYANVYSHLEWIRATILANQD